MPPRTSDPAASIGAALSDLGFELVRPSSVEVDVTGLGRDGFRVEVRRPAMTTLVRVTAIHRSAALAEDAIGRALAEMDRLIAIFNRHDDASALSVLNAEGHLEGPPPELPAVLAHALTCHHLSGGAFDPTVTPLVDLFEACFTGLVPREPTAAEVAEARGLVDAAAIAASRRRVRLTRRGTRLTLDGIAKGFIVDRMAVTLERAGIDRYLVEAGGDIRTAGRKEDRLPWAVAVRDPESGGRLPGFVQLTGGAIATSGSYERYYDPAHRFHHIVDAARGASPHDCSSATVIAPSATTADAIATAVFVLGSYDGVALVERIAGCACLIVRSDGRLTHSRGWKEPPP